jgi:GNAT superfamily N-acetyltransferase
MNLTWKFATSDDFPLLAEWNYQLIRDEGHRNPMTVHQLEERMRGWLSSEYQAVVFSLEVPVAYALFRKTATEVYLRQFFVDRTSRRQGIGRRSMSILLSETWPKDVRLTVDVLCSNDRGISFWRSVGYQDYCLTLEMNRNEN